MAAATRAFRLIITVGALVASGMIAVAGGAHAAPPAGSTPPWFGKGKATHAHLSTVLDRVARPAVAAGSAKAQAAAAGTPASGAGSLLRADSAHLRVDIRVDATDPATLSALSAAGARVTFVSAASHTVTAAVKPVDLVKVGSVAGVQYVSQIYTLMTAATCPSGSIVSEGDTQLNAATARTHYGIDGTGVTVGVLSDSFNRTTTPTSQADDIASGDLPGVGNPCGQATPVNNLDDTAPNPSDAPLEDEGRAMAQTVHDLAPGAHLAFATAFTGEEEFASNIKALATAGAKVIVDDVTYAEEPMYQDGIISNAVSSVTASGVSYFTAAANNNVIYTDGNGVRHNVGSYEATGGYRPTSCPAAFAGAGYLDCHNFSTSGTDNTYGLTIKPGGFINLDLQWAQPFSGVTTDLDAVLLNSAGNVIAVSNLDNLDSQEPFELLQYGNNTSSSQAVRVVIGRFQTSAPAARPRLKFIHLENGSTGLTSFEYNTSSGANAIGPTIFGHNGADKAGSVAAVPYSDANTPEYYSSRGPVTLLFNPVNGTTPATALGSPQTVAKPDFAATDCVQNTFFGSPSPPYRFCGTSDAAPHAAGVAALLLQQDPTLTPAQMRTRLASTAATVSHGSTTSTGAGLLDANPDGDTTTALSPSTTLAHPGDPVTLTATVSASVAGTPTGTVSFVDAGTALGTVPINGSGVASLTTSSLASGHRTIVARYNGDTDFNPSSATTNVAIDGTPPVVSVSEPAHLFPASKTITVKYSATDTISGVANYDVQRKIAPWNGVFTTYTTIRSHVTETTQTFTGTPGNEYCFSVRATDNAGNQSAWSSDHCVVVPLDDRDLGLATTGWSRGTSSGAYLGTVTRTTTAGAKLRKTGAQLNRIALIVTQCSTCGRIAIYFNGTLWRTISTYAASTHYKVVLIQPLTYLKTRTIELKAVDAGKKVIVDGLSVARQ